MPGERERDLKKRKIISTLSFLMLLYAFPSKRAREGKLKILFRLSNWIIIFGASAFEA
jgi:hypothetical protein